MKDFDYTVSLRVRHPSIDPKELTEKLGFAPHYSWRAGDRKQDASGEPGEGTYRETYWFGRLPSMSAETIPDRSPGMWAEGIPDLPLEGAIMFALLRLQRADEFWRALVASGGTARFIVEIYGGRDLTLDLSPATLAMLARFGVAISVDVHTEMQAVA
jgi:hypothetical protein